jgi:hypothetical protein
MAGHVDETFVIPASDNQIHDIRVRFHPFPHTS